MKFTTECPTCDGSGTAGHEADCPSPEDSIEICSNAPCESVLQGIPADMRLGDTCLLCCCRECGRCEGLIDLDEENQISDGDGYVDICDDCLTDDDVLYDDELEAERREAMA